MRAEDRRLAGGIAAIASCAFLWSTAGLLIKLLDWNPFAIAGARSAVAALVILAWVRVPRFTWSLDQILAALFLAATMALFVGANKTTTAANAILLQYIAPAVAAIGGGAILREKVRAEQWIAMAFVSAGLVIFFLEDVSGGALLGNILAILSGVTFGLHSVFMRKQKGGSPVESTILGNAALAVLCFAVCLFLPPPRVTAPAIAAILFLGVFQIGLAYILFSVAIKRISAVETMLLSVIEPLFNPLWVFAATGERPSAQALAGGGLILATVTISTIVSVRLAPSRLRAEGGGPAAALPSKREDEHAVERHAACLARAAEGGIDLLFIGDSITRRWLDNPAPFHSAFGRYRCANFGVGGDRTQDMLWRIQHGELDGLAPKGIVLLIGTNNAPTDAGEEIAAGVRRILEEFGARVPGARILLLAILPRGPRRGEEGYGPQARGTSSAIRRANLALAAMADGDRVRFADLSSLFLDRAGRIRADLMPDLLHPAGAGYSALATALRPLVDDLMRS